jgi:hypothetical protein
MDLRLLWVTATDETYLFTLRFFAPFRFVSELYGQPVSHTLTLILTAPDGDEITATASRSWNVSLKRGGEKQESELADFYVNYTDAIFELPKSLGTGPDWVVTTRSRIVADADFCPDPNFPNRYFEITTTPARLSALTGEGEDGYVSALPVPMSFDSVAHREYKAIEWTPREMPSGTRLESFRLEEQDGHTIAVLTMDGPFAFPDGGDPTVNSVALGLDLVAPGYLGLNHPFSIRIDLFSALPVTDAVVLAPVLRSEGGMRAIGTVPVSLDGDEVRIDLSAFTSVENSNPPPPFETGEGYNAELGTTAFTVEGTMTFEGPDGADRSEPFTLDVVGPALRFTFADGEVSTGWLDPYDNHYIADGPVISGGLGSNNSKDSCTLTLGQRVRRLQDVTLGREIVRVQEEFDAAANSETLNEAEFHRTFDNVVQLGVFVRKLRKTIKEEELVEPVKATGCGQSAITFSTVRAYTAQDDPLTKPDWAPELPEFYWDLDEIGVWSVGFGRISPAPFPFEAVTNWVPDSWGLTSLRQGWGIRAWSQVNLAPVGDERGVSPLSLTPYVAASLLLPWESEATPIATSGSHEAVLWEARRARRSTMRPRRKRRSSAGKPCAAYSVI